MFERFKVMGDIIKGGINNYKTGEKLEKLAERSQNEFCSCLRPEDLAKFAEFEEASKKVKNAPAHLSDEEKTALNDAKESVRLAYIVSLSENESLPEEFRNEINQALEEYQKSTPDAIFETAMMHYAKTPEKQEEFRKVIREIRNS